MVALFRLRRFVQGALVIIAIAVLPLCAFAQPPQPARPFRSLFNARPQQPGREQSLVLTVSGYGGYDDNVIGGQAGAGTDPRAQVGGGVVGTDAGLAYTKMAERTQFIANVGGGARYFPNSSTLSAASYSAGAGLSYQLAHRTRIQVGQNVGFQPYYQLGLFAGFPDQSLGAVQPSNLDYTVLKRSSILLGTRASLDQQLSRRSTLTLDYDFFDQSFESGNDQTSTGELTSPSNNAADLQSHGAGIHFRRQVSRYMSVRLGYQYRHAIYSFPERRTVDGHNIDAGVDYSRSLPLSRHTTLSFSTGSTMVSFDGRRYYNVTGNANLSHQFTPNWQGRVAYNRDLSFVASLLQPMFADSVTTQLQGILARRVMVTLTGGYLSGQLGLAQETTHVHTATGAFSLVYAFTDFLGATADYSYYSYNFSNNTELPTGLRPRLDRNSVRGGLTVWLPLIR
jgi:hypothetical protein